MSGYLLLFGCYSEKMNKTRLLRLATDLGVIFLACWPGIAFFFTQARDIDNQAAFPDHGQLIILLRDDCHFEAQTSLLIAK